MVAMYSDDTSLSYRFDDIHQLDEALRKDLTTVVEWLKGNKLSLNFTKTMSVVISRKQNRKMFNYK